MGWMEGADGSLSGDAPADTVGESLRYVAAKSLRTDARLPTGDQILHALVRALNLDGTLAPFYAEGRRVAALVATRKRRRMRVDGHAAADWVVAELYTMLEDVAEAYVTAWQRPPRLLEVLSYVAAYLTEPDYAEEIASDAGLWDLREAKFALGARKGKDRRALPATPEQPSSSGLRVRHPKFGEGTVVAEESDRITVQFGSDRRVLLRSYVEILS
jgi:hypothetical protein